MVESSILLEIRTQLILMLIARSSLIQLKSPNVSNWQKSRTNVSSSADGAPRENEKRNSYRKLKVRYENKKATLAAG